MYSGTGRERAAWVTFPGPKFQQGSLAGKKGEACIQVLLSVNGHRRQKSRGTVAEIWGRLASRDPSEAEHSGSVWMCSGSGGGVEGERGCWL